MNTDLISYYRERAKEYENIYLKPERQDDLERATAVLQDIFKNKNIFEINCGTGYWTAVLAKTAASIFATDINETVIEIARQKHYENANVAFGIADIYNYEAPKKYEHLFSGFIWSHIQVQYLQDFLKEVNRFIMPGGMVVFMDNNYVEGSNLPVTKTDEQGNTFQTRKLKDGSVHLVRKNFPSEAFIKEQLKDIAKDIQFISLEYYWILIYRTWNG